jgi:endonuclease G
VFFGRVTHMFDRPSRLPLRRTRQHKTHRLTRVRTWRIVATVTIVALASVYVAFAAISLSTSVPYSQNFNSMGIPLSNPAPSNLPADFSQDTIVPPRTLGSFGPGSTTTRAGGANMPNPASPGPYNFGAGTSTLGDSDRAVGFISNATTAGSGNLYALLRNNTGAPLTGLLISYDVEKYRNGSNPAGFRYQLFYSFDGSSWTNAGPDFFTGFAPDTNNNGFATAPGVTVPVSNKTLNVSVANGANIFLAWNYSVTSGFTTDNAQALAIDNISILGLNGPATNPSGVGVANPSSVGALSSTLLTVTVTPGTNPPSTAHTVTVDLSAIGGSASQQFFDDGTHGDVTAADKVYSFNATVPLGTNGGIKSLPFTINETSPFSRTATGVISLGVLAATNPSGVGTATPNSVLPGQTSTLSVTVTPGANPTSSGIVVTADLSSIGGAVSQPFIDQGNNVFSFVTTVDALTAPGPKSLPFSITDGQLRSASGAISLNVQQPVFEGPSVTATEPSTDGVNAPYDSTINVEFSEPVDVVGNWFDITCASSGQHNDATIASYNGAQGFHITPNTSFQFGEQCTVTIFHGNVHDQDTNDSSPNADTLAADHTWTFTVVAAGAPAPHPPSVHLTMGNPSNAVADLQQGDNYLMEKPSFALSYNKDKGTPNWVSWHLEDAWTGNLPRTDTFRADPAVSPDWYRVQATDYSGSGFERGQMTPSDDRNNEASIPLNQETFLMSNLVPQSAGNQGPWSSFENYLRTLLPDNEIYIVAGPAGTTTTIADGHVTVPTYTWKVALVLPAGENDLSRVSAATRTIAVIIPNVNGIDPDWHSYITTVDAVEALTGYDFFANVPDNVENAIEAGVNGTNPPGTENHSFTTAEDVPVDIVLNAASSFATPTLNFTIVSQPEHGVLSGGGPEFTYTPAANFHGSDSFTFRVNDGGAQDSNTSTVNINVTEVNDTPAANGQSVSTNSNTPVAITLTGSDLETASENLVFEVTVNPAHGSLSGTGTNLTYTPNANYSGPDSFEFTVRDTGDGASAALTSAAATVSITVNDTIAPTISAPANVTVNTGPDATTCGTVVSDAQLGTANASDNAGTVSVERSGVPSGNLFPVGTTTITYTATDGAGNSTPATQTVTVIDNTAPTLSAPAPTSVNADSSGRATIPDVVAGTTASDNCGPVTVTQSPLAGTVVGTGTHTITITATDAAGNTNTATTTFTVNSVNPGGGFTFSLSVSPATVKRNQQVKIDIAYANTSAQRLSVSFTIRYTSPCGSFVLDNVGPIPINAGTDKSANVPFHVPKDACTGRYTLTLEAYVGGVLVGTTTADLTVTP